MRMLEALRSFMFSKYRWLGFIGLFLLAVFVIPHYAYADYGVDTANTIVSYFLAVLTTVLSMILSMIGNLILLIIEILLVPVLQYNEFASSKIIGIGWSLVRDVMNMFVVAILIVIAMYTILNMKKAAWEQNLKNLFFAVVLMNFSRTICGVLIDISQVVMLTFVNALLDIAAGNFAQMWGINKFGEFSLDAVNKVLSSNGAGHTVDATGLFMSTLAQIPLYLVIFGVLLAMAVAFLYRIVVLWVLTIMSPMAFFMGGIKDIMPGIASGEKQWWSKFNAALLMGPILAFFLWLALSVSSSSNLLEAEGFKLPVPKDTPSFIVEALAPAQLGATLIAIVLLITGMGIAAEQAKGLGGLAASWVTEGWAKKLATVGAKGALRTGDKLLTTGARVAASPFNGAGVVLGAGLERFGSGAVKNFGTWAKDNSKGGFKAPRSLEDSAIAGMRSASEGIGSGLARVGEATGSSMLLGAAGSVAAFSKKSNDAQRAAAKKRIESMTNEEKLARLRGIETGSVPNDLESEEIAGLLRADFIKNKGTQKKYEEQYSGDSKKNLLSSSINTLSTGNADNGWMDGADLDKQKHKLFHMLSNEEQEKFRNSDAFDPKNLSQDSVDALYEGSMANVKPGTPAEEEAQRKRIADDARMYQALLDTKNDKGERFGDRLVDGKIQGLIRAEESTDKKKIKKARETLQKAQENAGRTPAQVQADLASYLKVVLPFVDNPKYSSQIDARRVIIGSTSGQEEKDRVQAMHTAAMSWANAAGRTQDEVNSAVAAGVIDTKSLASSDFDPSTGRGRAVLMALAHSGNGVIADMQPAVGAQYRSDIASVATTLNPANPADRKAAVSIASSGDPAVLSSMPQAGRNLILAALNNPASRAEAKASDLQKSFANLVKAQAAVSTSSSNPVEVVFNGVKVDTPATMTFTDSAGNNRTSELSQLLRENPAAASHFAGAIPSTSANKATAVIVRSVTKEAIEKMAKEIQKQVAAGTLNANLKKGFDVISEAAEREMAGGKGKKDRERADNLNEHIETMRSLYGIV